MAAQFDALDKIAYDDDPVNDDIGGSLILSGGGAVDLSNELGARDASRTTSDTGNTVTADAVNDYVSGGTGNDTSQLARARPPY